MNGKSVYSKFAVLAMAVGVCVLTLNSTGCQTGAAPAVSSQESPNVAKPPATGGQDANLPSQFLIAPKDTIAAFHGEQWPFSNVEPAIYGALGLFYGKTEQRNEAGALVNSEMEYSVHNVLTGHAFALFYGNPDDSLSMVMYGFTPRRLDMTGLSNDDIITEIKQQICLGNVVHINEGEGPFDYIVWGYKNNGITLLGYQFSHGNDMQNCGYDFDNYSVYHSLAKDICSDAFREKGGSITFIRPDSQQQRTLEAIYRRALAEGYRMLTNTEPLSPRQPGNVEGYGQSLYAEWIRQIEQADAENREEFYDTSPIMPHFIALFENRLHIWRFLTHYNKQANDAHLQKAIELSEQLKNMAFENFFVTIDFPHNPMQGASHHDKRVFLVDALKKYSALELEIAEQIKLYLDSKAAAKDN
ncbi:MAG: hypothetical protein FWE88_04750 [Phycisphaerae bacterium]|nr:hypothetical protein [Phycisphaerae bacterium]